MKYENSIMSHAIVSYQSVMLLFMITICISAYDSVYSHLSYNLLSILKLILPIYLLCKLRLYLY